LNYKETMSTLNEVEFKQYLEVYYKTLTETAKQFLPSDAIPKLQVFSVQPARIVGYLSNTFGVGFEYIQDKTRSDIEIIKGNSRIENLFLKVPMRVRELSQTGMLFAPESGGICTLDSIHISDGYPLRIKSENITIRILNSTFEALGWKKHVLLGEIHSNREKAFWSPDAAISRAKDEILIAMTNISRAKNSNLTIGDFIKQSKEKSVLILGSYSKEQQQEQQLREIAKIIQTGGYNSILIKDIPDNLEQNINQKVVAVGSVSRFIIVEDSYASGHLTELSHCKNNDWVTIILREKGKQSSFMSSGLSITSKVIKEFEYTIANLEDVVKESVMWAEKTIEDNKRSFASVYPWRNVI